MKAILKTRCGCTGGMDIEFPPPYELKIPLRGDFKFTADGPVQPETRPIRRFHLARCWKAKVKDGRHWALYLEVE